VEEPRDSFDHSLLVRLLRSHSILICRQLFSLLDLWQLRIRQSVVCVRLVRIDQHVCIGQFVWTIRWLLPIIIVDLSDVHVFDHRELPHLRRHAGLWMVRATTTHLSLLIASHWFPTRGYSSDYVLSLLSSLCGARGVCQVR
jgi:hypothetical protein